MYVLAKFQLCILKAVEVYKVAATERLICTVSIRKINSKTYNSLGVLQPNKDFKLLLLWRIVDTWVLTVGPFLH